MNIEFDEKAYDMSRGFGTACASIRVTPEPEDKEHNNGSLFNWLIRVFAEALANSVDFEPVFEWYDNEGNTWEWGDINVYGNSYDTTMFAYEDNCDIVQIELTPEHIQQIKNGKPFVITGSISLLKC